MAGTGRNGVLTPEQADRAAGVLVGAACGDALGVPYEFAARIAPGTEPVMSGGGLGPYAPGEYSDDTQMAVCIAEVTAAGVDLRDDAALDAVAASFLRWRQQGATDVGAQTAAVLRDARHGNARTMRDAAAALHARTGRSAGNGSLMRTAVVALAYLDDLAGMAEAARAVSSLTHFDDLAGDACVLWCAGVRRAVLGGTLAGVRAEGLGLMPAGRVQQWQEWLDDAEHAAPQRFCPNGFVVPALQAAWSAVTRSLTPGRAPEDAFREAMTAAVGAGNDTDTVAAIAGAMAGAATGEAAIPAQWRAAVHGWPDLNAEDLAWLALQTTRRGGQ